MANHNITITATDKSKKALKNVDKGLDKASRRALMLKGALGLAAGAMAALGAVKIFGSVIDDMDTLAKRARNVGIESEVGFAKFQVASKLLEQGGLEISEVDRMFRNLEGRMAAGLAGNKEYAAVMDKLGDSIFDANGDLLEAPDLFAAVATAMQEGNIDLADAQKLLGEMVGPKVLGIFTDLENKGISAGEALAQTAEGMNLIAQADAEKAEKFNDAMDDLKRVGKDLLTEFITPMLPAMTTFVQDLAAKAPGFLDKFKTAMDGLQPVFDAIGLVLDTIIVPMLTSFIDLIKDGAAKLMEFAETHPTITTLGIAVTALGAAFLLLNPVALVVAGITAAFAFWPDIKKFIDDVAESLGGYDAIFENVSVIVTAFKELALEAFGAVADFVLNSLGFENIGVAIQAAKDKFDEVVEQFGLQPLVDMVSGAIDLVMGQFNRMIEFWTGFPETINEKVQEIKDYLGSFGMLDAKEKVEKLKDDVVQQFTDLKDKVMAPVHALKDGVVGAFEKLGNILVWNSVVPEMKEAIIAEFRELGEKTVLTTDEMVTDIKSDYEKLAEVMEGTTKKGADAVKDNMKEAADAATDFVSGVNKDFNDRLVDGLVDGNLSFDTFADLWKSTLKDLLKDTLNGGSLMKDIFSNFGGFGGGSGLPTGLGSIGSSLFGGSTGGGIGNFFSGLWGGVTDFFGGLFGGFFANGGMIPAGQFGVVGEAGPELISGPAKVTSNEDAFGPGNSPAINITIQAIDTQTGTEFLLKNKKQIEGIIQNAYNRRGKQGIY